MRALAGVAVTKDPTSASANDAQTKASAAPTTRKNFGSNGDEALSQFEVTGMICKGAMRKIRDNAELQFYVEGHLSYPHPAIHYGIRVNTLFDVD
jgi:tartrate dehydratase beta subunit/fumarate hydratase class I family protein